MKKFIFVVALLFFGISKVYADCLEEGLESFKQVADAVYKEMGQPEVNLKSMTKLQHEIFIRPSRKKPAFHPNSSISWIEHPDALGAIVTCAKNGEPVSQRVLWRPDEDLEPVEMDAVFSW